MAMLKNRRAGFAVAMLKASLPRPSVALLTPRHGVGRELHVAPAWPQQGFPANCIF